MSEKQDVPQTVPDPEVIPKTREELLEEAKERAEYRQQLIDLGIGDPYEARDVNLNDIIYLSERWQFLEIKPAGENLPAPPEKPELIEIKSGWTVVKKKNKRGETVMATSPGRFIFRGGYFQILWDEEEDDDEGGGGVVNGGHGTIIKQAFDSAAEMMRLAQAFGWEAVQIIDGHPRMQRAAWMEACRIGVKLRGYGPSMEAERQRRRIMSSSVDEMHEVLQAVSKA